MPTATFIESAIHNKLKILSLISYTTKLNYYLTFLSITSHFFLALREACSMVFFFLGDLTGSPDGLPAAPENLEVEDELLSEVLEVTACEVL